ncbi:MAG: DUF3179 domain-containing (seleno)protein [Ilumatobacteraceae bacterium]
MPALAVAVWVATRDDGNVTTVVPADPSDVYSPVAAGEPLPDGFFQILPRDFITPIYAPEFVAGDSAGWPDDADVIGVTLDGEAKAYPLSVLNSSEMVVDELAGVPILVTWCPLCGTALVHRRELDGEPVVFGVQGALWLNAMTWWDHDTGSIWSQPLGEAIAGPLTGRTVELLPSEFTTWSAWRAGHPDTLALDVDAGPTGFDLADLFIVVDFGEDVRAYPVSDVRQVGVANDVVAGLEIAVVSDPADPDRWAVFSRRVGGDTIVELEVVGSELRDRVTGTTFDPIRGIGLRGDLADEILDRLPAFTTFPGGGPTRVPIFEAFWPEGTVWRP